MSSEQKMRKGMGHTAISEININDLDKEFNDNFL